MRLALAAIVVAGILGAARLVAQELPRCPKEGCGQTVHSSWWKHCPMCGGALPAFALDGAATPQEAILGNVYVHGGLGIRVECPNQGWQILKGKGARDLHPSATMAMTCDPGFYALLIVKEIPGSTLEQYAEQVVPSLKPVETVENETRTVDGRKAIVRTFRGKKQDIDFVFRILVAEDGGRKVQVVCWALAPDYDKPEGKEQVGRIIDSFRFVAPAATGGHDREGK